MFYDSFLSIRFMCLFTSTGLCTTIVEAGYFFNNALGLMDLSVKLPPQLGQTFFKTSVAQVLQYVHSKVQIMASFELWGNLVLQFSQVGRIWSIVNVSLYSQNKLWFF